MIRLALPLLLFGWMPQPSAAQLVVDTLFTWQGYGHESTCRVRIFKSAPGEDRASTIVIDELARNPGPSVFDDVRHVAELVGRTFAQTPDDAYWIFRWGDFSFPGAEPGGKEVFFRATFRRSAGGGLGPPYWRLIKRETVVEYTDRAFE